MKYSILKYGSLIRGNSDSYSDKDLLIVSDNFNNYPALKKLFPTDWSISFYTYDRLQYLADNGYLFVKHLLDEGKIEHDSDNLLKTILVSFNENKDYSKEIMKTQNFFSFIHAIPNNSVSFSWLCDNIYVNFRNYLIYNSATSGKYKFSYIELISSLLDTDLIKNQDFEVLKELRVIKACYRNKFKDIFPSLNYTLQLISIMKKFDIEIDINFIDDSNFLKTYDLTKDIDPYRKLRLIELQYKNLGIEDKQMEKFVTSPQFYANSKSIKRVINKFLSCHLKKQHITANKRQW